ncbi:hypothetical protein B0T17DRAFT_617516 [Bombardia bombarda]|uniref:RING-type E3 ubiquitin transferase n=1 Tax=Bombardia bombarda TaxID=252184 RepID=A0AA39X185_9PEZI|nr:hypothetical protein B0T17DRAFT_617516 [Bombardia bombarda]
MSSPLSAEEKAEYTRIIDGILAAADLETVTRKKIRSGLEAAIGKDLNSQKVAIKSLIEARFDAISTNATQTIPTPPSGAAPESSPKHEATNGHSPSDYAEVDYDDDDANGEIKVSLPPAKKKVKRESSDEDADARLAAELQAQENRLSRGPLTRGGGATKVTKKAKAKPKAKTPKKKSDKRVRSDDESDVDGSDAGATKKRKAGGGFQKPFTLSYPLAELCGEQQLSRPQVVKKLWEYIKGNDLQDPSDRRQILCDEKMQAIFKQTRVDMFQMNKLLGHQLYPVEEEHLGATAVEEGEDAEAAAAVEEEEEVLMEMQLLVEVEVAEVAVGVVLPGEEAKAKAEAQDAAADDDDAEVCFICANPMLHHSVSPCNHATCHICALRLRALYKNQECPHCRTAAPFVIFTDDANKRYEEYTDKEITSTDDNIGIRYTSEDIVGDSVLLLRYNCPDGDCDFAGLGWPDLHRHVRTTHHKKLCDLCTRNKKVFTHEHDMFNDKELGDHMRHGDDKPGAIDQTGFKGHPLCSFCGERFYDDDKLYEHCRNKHERCFICDRRDSRKPHYYMDYNALEGHFKNDHFLCIDRECLEKKFVVFESEIDLKAHQLSEHGNSLSKDVRRDARLVDMSGFDFRQPYQQERRGGPSGGRDHRGRGRDPNAEALPVSSAQPLRRDELAFQRQMAIHNSAPPPGPSHAAQPTQTSRRTNAGAAQQSSRGGGSSQQQQSSQPLIDAMDAMETLTIADLSSLTQEQRASLTRHSAVIERASNLLGNNAAKIATFRSYISDFNKASMTAGQVIGAFFALFSETSANALGTLVREVADLFDDKKKGETLRSAFQNWRVVNEDYPSLPTLGGMHGATTASSGWAVAAAASPRVGGPAGPSSTVAAAQSRNSTRVLRLKNSTRRGSNTGLEQAVLSIRSNGAGSSSRGGGGGGGGGGSTAFSDRAASRATPSSSSSSSSSFPALPGASKSAKPSQPSWIGGGSSSSGGRTAPPPPAALQPSSRQNTSSGGGRRGGGGGEDAFPALPAAPKPQTTIFGYGGGRALGRRSRRGCGGAIFWGAAADDAADGGKGGKKKNKKQVVMQWG